MNRPDNPCNPDPDYNLGHCVDKYVMRRIGCQPPWRRVNIEGLPICDNGTMLYKYDYSYWWAVDSGRDMLRKLTKCLMPCSFMEYKVSYFQLLSKVLCYVEILQITENPKFYTNLDGSTGTKIWPVFSPERTLVRKEVEAFPLISLVADCGGILGLFLGFNFLMIWEWIMDFILFCVIRVIRIKINNT